MKPYHIHIPTDIYFGRNIWEESLKNISYLLNGNIMIATTGRSLVRLGYLENLKKSIARCPMVRNITVFDKISANPKLSEVKEGIELAVKTRTDVIIGFGGGSAGLNRGIFLRKQAGGDGSITGYSGSHNCRNRERA